MQESLADMHSEAQRASSLTRQLLFYSRGSVIHVKRMELTAVLGNISRMLRRLMDEHIDFLINGAAAPLWIDADSGMIELVVMNLCLNARDAMPKGGRLIMRTNSVVIDADHVQRNPEHGRQAFSMS